MGYNSSQVREQRRDTPQKDTEDSPEQGREQWVEEQVERGTNTLVDRGVETEEFGMLSGAAAEVQSPVAGTAGVVVVVAVVAAAAVLAAAVAAVAAAAAAAAAEEVVEVVVDTDTVETSTSCQPAVDPINRFRSALQFFPMVDNGYSPA